MQAARRRIRTRRSSNCSNTSSHRDFPGGRGKGRGSRLRSRNEWLGLKVQPGDQGLNAQASSLEQEDFGVMSRPLGIERRAERARQESKNRLLKAVGSCPKARCLSRECLETSAPQPLTLGEGFCPGVSGEKEGRKEWHTVEGVHL